MDMTIELVKETNACPEQYLAYNDDDIVGYIRFRFGQLEVHPTDENGDILFEITLLEHSVNDDYLGVIPNKYKEEWLNESIEKIKEYYETHPRKH